ncbi:endonuclease MutS2 [Sediminicola luteus]|uniref:DNA mismatch repair protein MutS n=1 Tax=Sediminicola luteus TaxID=319238 RepID=A0A2A4G754_9FLAO|nr:DNA mismatch repair protein MutS [Sediminicola luteus]PCE63800.1 DNA mismatch repair protein MutS [Sediminicola luteus]
MGKIHSKTLQDLEFPTVLEQLTGFCVTEMGKTAALKILPFRTEEEILNALGKTSEYLASFENENRIPNHGFESISEYLKLLKIENTTLEVSAFKRINALCSLIQEHHLFFKKFQEYYPLMAERALWEEPNTEIPKTLGKVLDRFGEIKDKASPALWSIRQQIQEVRVKINQSFAMALGQCQSQDLLDEIRESVIDNRRVLAVKAMYRKRVKGTAMGTSKTGSIVYIEPEACRQQTSRLSNLEFDEREEIRRILKELTDFVRPFGAQLQAYQVYFTETDLTAAKAKYGMEMNALLPKINKQKELYLRDAYHPLLYLSNKRKREKTYPQTIELHPENRIIVISGPNAGGKSITLKTIGLLQVMLQSGMLIPVHERSSVCLFGKVMTDIGDNQSIENHLSTYSYRLKNMNYFLRQCDKNTLFLIDEFGTGSDPELGGALAETFLEMFYDKQAYGVITTHYSNLKMLADELPFATNANMIFDSRTLEPTFQLVLGQAGSSFTFEVAQKNGIPYSLINKAKKKIERGKVRFDATIAKLQKERSKMEKTGKTLQQEEVKAREEAQKLEKLNDRIKTKLENYQELYDTNQRMIYLGTKLNDAAEKYFLDKKKRPLISELLRIVEVENSKRKKTTAKEVRQKKAKKEVVNQEVLKEIKVVREKKKEAKKKAVIQEKNKPKPILRIGDRVRLTDGKAVGTLEKIEKNKALINYGLFTTSAPLDQLELVQAMKGKS